MNRLLPFFLLFAAPAAFAAGDLPMVAGLPVDFILFALTLLGVALFHNATLYVALGGLTTISLYKILFTGFKTGVGVAGFFGHLGHEWVTLSNLFCLLTGFAILARHFEKSHVPVVLPKFLPDDWKGGFVLLVMVFVISSFLDNIAAALIGGAMAHQLFKSRVHVGFLAAIVAASNAGGSGSVVGDTTTTMMWIDGVSPLTVLDAYVASGVALCIIGYFGAKQQHAYSPIIKHSHEHTHVDWGRIFIVFMMLTFAIITNVTVNVKYPALADSFPFIGVAVWAAILLTIPIRRHDWEVLPDTIKGSVFLLSLVTCASMMPVEELPRRLLADGPGPGLCLRRLRQHSPHSPGPAPGGLRLGLPGLRRGLRGVHAVVRFLRWGGPGQHVSGGEIGRPVAEARLARDRGLRGGLLRAAGRAGLATGCGPQGGRHPCAASDGRPGDGIIRHLVGPAQGVRVSTP